MISFQIHDHISARVEPIKQGNEKIFTIVF
jgi:hypothetical protein